MKLKTGTGLSTTSSSSSSSTARTHWAVVQKPGRFGPCVMDLRSMQVGLSTLRLPHAGVRQLVVSVDDDDTDNQVSPVVVQLVRMSEYLPVVHILTVFRTRLQCLLSSLHHIQGCVRPPGFTPAPPHPILPFHCFLTLHVYPHPTGPLLPLLSFAGAVAVQVWLPTAGGHRVGDARAAVGGVQRGAGGRGRVPGAEAAALGPRRARSGGAGAQLCPDRRAAVLLRGRSRDRQL